MRYLNAFFSHDLMNKDPEKRKKITGIIFEIGYACRRYCECPHGYECKYRPDYRYHNWSVRVRRWIYQKLGIDIKVPWYFQKHRVDFSGTTRCPHNMYRIYTCYECKHLGCVPNAELGLGCLSEDYRNSAYGECHDEDTPPYLCKFFDLDPSYVNYDKKTGEIMND